MYVNLLVILTLPPQPQTTDSSLIWTQQSLLTESRRYLPSYLPWQRLAKGGITVLHAGAVRRLFLSHAINYQDTRLLEHKPQIFYFVDAKHILIIFRVKQRLQNLSLCTLSSKPNTDLNILASFLNPWKCLPSCHIFFLVYLFIASTRDP